MEFPEYYEPKNTHKIFGITKDVHRRLESTISTGDICAFNGNVTRDLDGLDFNQLTNEFLRIRRELKQLQQIYYSCSEKISQHKDLASMRSFRSDVDLKISMLKKKSIYIVYRKAQKEGFRRLDLHGLTLQESQELIITVLDHLLRDMTGRNLKKYFLDDTRFNLEIVTGKGRHSDGDPVLFPMVQRLLSEQSGQGYEAKPSKDLGKLDVTIKL